MAGSGGPLSHRGLRGREAELAELQALIASVARTGSGGLALIQGEPGIGKTTLLAEAASRAGAAGFSVGLGKADELHRIVPLSSLAASVLHGDRPLLSGDDLADLARNHDQRIWLVERLAEAIEARATDTPVLIGLDDVQWADALSRFALQQLPTRLRTSPVLWMLTGRREPAGPAEEIVAAATGNLPTVTVSLGPLSGAAIGQLADDTLGPAVDAWVRDLLDGAGGNPFLAIEMLAGLRTADASQETVPSRLVVGVRGRLRSLQPGTLRFLQMGAVLGRRFGFEDAAALCDRPAAALFPALEEAVRAGLLDDDGDQLVFRHDLLRQAVYADIPPSARKALHREAARRLVSAGRQPIDAVPHILRGAVPGDEEAVTLLRRVADEVLAVTPGPAADLMLRALELSPSSGRLKFEVGEQTILCLTRAGRNSEALETGDRLLAGRPPLETFGRLQSALGGALWTMDLTDELRRRAEAALAAGGSAPEICARLAALRALALSRGRDLAAAREAGETALRTATDIGDREAHVLALSGLGETALNAGENAVALERFAALSAIDSAFLPEEVVAHLHVDDFASAERLLLRAAERGGAVRQAMLLWAQGQHDLGLGRLDDAEADFVTMERLEDEVRVSVQQLNGRVIRSRIALLRGDREAAREHLLAARERLAVKPNPGNTAAVRFLEAVHAEADGDVALAVDRIRRVQQQGPFMRWRLLRDWVDAAVRMSLRGGERRLAEDLAAQAEAHAGRNPSVPTATGVAAQARGLVRNDPAVLGHAVELLEASPRPLTRAAAHADLGLALLAAGRPGPAATVLAHAHGTFAGAGAHAEAARVQHAMESTGAGGRRAATVQRPVQGWGALTASEEKVARLIAQGHTNRSAADVLVVSPHTVNTHLTSVFRKLSIGSRVQLANLVASLPEG
ncbi:AAA family ATPase [Kitasatospora aureofaciens]|uniref:Transcriptional regulator n=1 Tax=Kitasatospora aureofaciens TaxID=1894 RepID=A0A1E7N1D9_KITAU|nr:LuxR family transcriptional regulator [Kitasatospora aureofaciens]OEV34507.1 transcriptional regulator [Kitasatospora aureofaciens]GGU57279.1 helix-turn-helix transcriptional regulator [Kitasatospora aureofaciens]